MLLFLSVANGVALSLWSAQWVPLPVSAHSLVTACANITFFFTYHLIKGHISSLSVGHQYISDRSTQGNPPLIVRGGGRWVDRHRRDDKSNHQKPPAPRPRKHLSLCIDSCPLYWPLRLPDRCGDQCNALANYYCLPKSRSRRVWLNTLLIFVYLNGQLDPFCLMAD